MKIVIGTVQVPFVTGGAEFLARNLKQALLDYGHEAEIVTMPFADLPPARIAEHIIAARLMDQRACWGGKVDRFIGLKFPAYCMPHPNKVVWALHQHRAAYELFDTPYSNLRNDLQGQRARQAVINADALYLTEAKRIYTISDNVTGRMRRYSGLSAETLYHPCPDMEKFTCGKSENYILMPSRINVTKRQMLALEALTESKSNISLYLVGKPEAESEKQKLQAFIREHGLGRRVRFFDYVSQEEKFRLYADARAVLFIPKDEDYGYITLEGMAAAKPVITAEDSGGPLEFVENGKTGYITQNTPAAIAEAIDALAEDRNLAIRMGEAGKQALAAKDISWEKVVEELTR